MFDGFYWVVAWYLWWYHWISFLRFRILLERWRWVSRSYVNIQARKTIAVITVQMTLRGSIRKGRKQLWENTKVKQLLNMKSLQSENKRQKFYRQISHGIAQRKINLRNSQFFNYNFVVLECFDMFFFAPLETAARGCGMFCRVRFDAPRARISCILEDSLRRKKLH